MDIAPRTPLDPPRTCGSSPASCRDATRLALWRHVRRVDRLVHVRTSRYRTSSWAVALRSVVRRASTAVRPRLRGFVLSDYGVWLRDRPEDVTHRMCVLGAYGADLANLLDAQEGPFGFIDIGANVGLYSLIALRNPACVAVKAFEPDPRTLPFLRDNLARHGSGRWEVHPVGLWSAPGSATLATHATHSGASTIRPTDAADGAEVRLVDGRYVLECLQGLTAALVVKVDVEGHEDRVLAGLLPVLGGRIALLWIEFSETTDRAACVALLAAHGFHERLRVGKPHLYDALWARDSRS